ncbi:MAG: hypothetical protein JW913_16810 [Chitinispirillaceae bacterium]|nr:hypothetical protein [Chitinispirillaceae bacterium]
MISEQDIAIYAAQSETATKMLEKKTEIVETKIREIDEDASLFEPKRIAKRKAVRDEANAGLVAEMRVITEAHDNLARQKDYWESAPFMLSRYGLSASASEIATIDAMDNATLELTFKHAKESGNRGQMFHCWKNAGARRLPGFSIADVDFPEATRGLAALKESKARRAYAESLFGRAWGRRENPVDKISYGRNLKS